MNNTNRDEDETLNVGLTAIPMDADLVATAMDFGNMNAKEARESGYIGEDGKAVAMAKKDVEGSPTGALTDIGAGRSSVVHSDHRREIDR